jgi:hypothetical protein
MISEKGNQWKSSATFASPLHELLNQFDYKQVKGIVIPSNLEADWTSKEYSLEIGDK